MSITDQGLSVTRKIKASDGSFGSTLKIPLAEPAATPGSIGVVGSNLKVRLGNSTLLTLGGVGGTVTSVGITPPADVFQAGAPVTTSGNITLTKVSQPAKSFYATPSGAAGVPTFRNLTVVDLPTGIPNANLATPNFTVTPGTGLSGGGTVAIGGSLTLNLADTAVTPGMYTNTTVTVDQQGRITTISSGSGGSTPSLAQVLTVGNTSTSQSIIIDGASSAAPQRLLMQDSYFNTQGATPTTGTLVNVGAVNIVGNGITGVVFGSVLSSTISWSIPIILPASYATNFRVIIGPSTSITFHTHQMTRNIDSSVQFTVSGNGVVAEPINFTYLIMG